MKTNLILLAFVLLVAGASGKTETEQEVVVLGQAASPGPVTVSSEGNLLDVILAAGGFSDLASGIVEVKVDKKKNTYQVVFDAENEVLAFYNVEDESKQSFLPLVPEGAIILIHERTLTTQAWQRWSRTEAKRR